MGKNLDRLKQTYALGTPNMAQTLGAMGRGNDSLVAHITPEEAMLLKQRGGAGTINPRTGLLEFFSENDSSQASEGHSNSGAEDGGGGWGGGDWGGNVDFGGWEGWGAPAAPSTPGLGFAGDNPNSGMANVTGNSSPGLGFAGDNPNSGMANVTGDSVSNVSTNVTDGGYNNAGGNYIGAPVVSGPVVNDPVVSDPVSNTPVGNTPVGGTTTTPATQNTFQFAAPVSPAFYGFELNRLMQQYGLPAPTITPYGGFTPTATQTDAARQEYDQNIYKNYMNEYQNRLANTNMYNQSQFVADPTKFAPQYTTPIANPTYAPTNYGDIRNIYSKYFGRQPEQAGVEYWGKTGLTGDALQKAITTGAQNEDLEYLRKNYPDLGGAPQPVTPPDDRYYILPISPITTPDEGGIYPAVIVYGPDGTAYSDPGAAIRAGVTDYTYSRPGVGPTLFARGGYAEGGEAEGEREERSSAGAMTPDQARRYRELMTRYLPSTNYGPQLAAAQQTARSEADAFSNMIRQMSERAESPTSRAEMYFRLASAFGAPTRTGQFTENLALAGREMGEVARGRRAEEAERRALGLRAQELRMAGARQDLASLQALAGQESAERRAILPRLIEAEVRANTPNARENRINDVMQTLGIGRPLAVGIVDNIITVVPGGPGEPPVLINRATGEIIPTRMGAAPVVGTQPAGQPAEQPPAEQPAVTPSAPAAGEIPAVNLRRQQAAPTVPATPSGATTPAAPGSVEDFYAGRRQRGVEQAGQTAEAEARGRVSAPPAPRQDFRYTQDFQAVEPIPGSQAAQERERGERAERVRRETTQQMGGTVIRAIDDIQQTMRTATFPTTGYFGQQLSTLGGSAANNIRTDIETIRSNIGFDQLNQMRQASPTGAALGSITERELNFLQSVLGSLDQSQTEAQFLRNLRRLRETYIEIINYGLGDRPPVQIPGPGGRGTPEPPRAGASGEIRSPSGLIIRPIQ